MEVPAPISRSGGCIHHPDPPPEARSMGKIPLLVVPLVALAAIQKPSVPDLPVVPVGGVILWWGMEDDLPYGFEVCDGTLPSTQGATLKERKPDLRDRFVKGAAEVSGFRPRSAVSGGSNDTARTVTSPHVLLANEIPGHTHPIPHQHTIDHTHRVPDHTHPIGPHVHAMGEWVDSAALTGTGIELLRNNPAGTDACAPAPPASTTGSSAALQTGPATPNLSGASNRTDSGQNATTNQGHTHDVPAGDNRPAFLEMLFAIRVK
jgi:hypothetical protein